MCVVVRVLILFAHTVRRALDTGLAELDYNLTLALATVCVVIDLIVPLVIIFRFCFVILKCIELIRMCCLEISFN